MIPLLIALVILVSLFGTVGIGLLVLNYRRLRHLLETILEYAEVAEADLRTTSHPEVPHGQWRD